MVLLEVFAVYEKDNKDLVIALPVKTIAELGEMFQQSAISKDEEIIYVSARKLVKHMQPNQIREALMKGYVEMSHINLSICWECLHAEYEAEHTVERLVSGG